MRPIHTYTTNNKVHFGWSVLTPSFCRILLSSSTEQKCPKIESRSSKSLGDKDMELGMWIQQNGGSFASLFVNVCVSCRFRLERRRGAQFGDTLLPAQLRLGCLRKGALRTVNARRRRRRKNCVSSFLSMGPGTCPGFGSGPRSRGFLFLSQHGHALCVKTPGV